MSDMSPKVHEAVIKVLQETTALKIDNFEAMEVFIRCLISVALDAADGDNAVAADWIDKWLLPNILYFQAHLKRGGSTPPSVIEGQRIN